MGLGITGIHPMGLRTIKHPGGGPDAFITLKIGGLWVWAISDIRVGCLLAAGLGTDLQPYTPRGKRTLLAWELRPFVVWWLW